MVLLIKKLNIIMATRRDFTLSVGMVDLKCFLNEEQEVVITIDGWAGDYISIKIDINI